MIFWMGLETGWEAVLVAEQKVAEGQKQGRYMSAAMEAELPPLWSKVGSVGVVSISGSLINGSAGWMRLFGVNGYDDIRSAMTAAVNDPDVKSLMFKVSSPGGQVHGLADFAKDVNRISQMKPSLTYVPDTMASAAYWSGSAVAGPIVMADTAEVGSIGVMMVTRNISKQLEMNGVSMKIHRSGEMKARINPIEEITPEAQADLDGQLADLHAMFRGAVKKNRPGMSAEMLQTATDGRVFLGKRAVTAGLADSLGSFDLALKLLDKGSRRKDTSPNSKGATMHMTAEQIAKFQAALMLGKSQIEALAAAGVVLTPEQEAEIKTADEAAKQASAEAAQKAADDEAAKKAAAAAAAPGDTSAMALLQSQLVTAQAEARASRDELVTLKATTQAQADTHAGLLAIARQAVATMLVPMGGTSASAEAMDATAVIAEHARVRPLFLEKFKAGQQSKGAAAEAPATKIDANFRTLTMAAVAASADKTRK